MRGLLAGLAALLLMGWGLGALVTAVAQGPDADAVGDLVGQRDSLLTLLAHAFSWAGSGFVIATLTLLLCAILYRRGERSSALAIALSVAGGIAIANLDKLFVARPRPLVHHLESVNSFSFPSGHTTQAASFYLALLIALLVTKPSRSLAIAAALATGVLLAGIALSRVYLGVHYPTDVAAGVLLGGSWSLLTARIVHGRSWARRRDGSAR
jgi:undecaprenyl-diphosphatase